MKQERGIFHEIRFGIQNFRDPLKAISDYIDCYNNERIKRKTKWMPPSRFREASMNGL
ncbi:MAG: IS3 family transposase [Bacilli bacterium]|nr:IS3 family transposase [Bacilli bacterium]